MGIEPKAIFLDMDGTILNHQNKVTNHTKEIISDLRHKGILVFIATGRDYREIMNVLPEDFQVDGYITSNGMAGYVGDETIFEHSLSLRLVETIIEKARNNQVYYELFPYGSPRVTMKQDRAYAENEIREPKPDDVGIGEWLSRKQAINQEIAWKDHVQGDKFSKFYFFARTKEHINAWKKELDELKQEMDFSTSISSAHNVEVMVANVNKATGIQQMLQQFHLSVEETLAMGDSNNDLQMLKLVGHSVAMKNATDTIKAATHEVTQFTCDEDGVYHYLKAKFNM